MGKLESSVQPSPFEKATAEILVKLHNTLISKNKDYGDAYAKSVDKYGQTVTLIRLADKFSRLENLILSDNLALVSESIDDTLLDLAGYAILELERRQRILTKINMAPDHIKIVATEININPVEAYHEKKLLNDFFKKPPYADLDD